MLRQWRSMPNTMAEEMTDIDPYRILGVDRSASMTTIKRAYRSQMLVWHPDINSSAEALLRAKAINRAFDTLSDTDRRAEYDRRVTATPTAASEQGGSQPADDTWDAVDPGIRTWPARVAVAIAKVGPFSIPIFVLLWISEWVLEWFDVALIGFRVFWRLRPWPKAVYWIAWEVAAILTFGACMSSMVSGGHIGDQVASITVWMLVLLPALYLPIRWVGRRVRPARRGAKSALDASPRR
jgi:hypothetical protein